MTEQSEIDQKLTTQPSTNDQKPRRVGKTTYYNGTIADRLVFAQSVTNGLNNNPETRAIMRNYGYTDDKIAQFTKLHAEAASANTQQQIEYGEKLGAHDTFEKNFAIAKRDLSGLIKVAKVALKDDITKIERLDLNGKKTGSNAAILTYMGSLYEALLADPATIVRLAGFGYNEQRLLACRDSYIQARNSHNTFKDETADAKKATINRDALMEELNEWMYDYYSLAKAADLYQYDYENNNQLH